MELAEPRAKVLARTEGLALIILQPDREVKYIRRRIEHAIALPSGFCLRPADSLHLPSAKSHLRRATAMRVAS